MAWRLLWVVLVCFLFGQSRGQTATDARNLKEYLFTNKSYDYKIRPITDQSSEIRKPYNNEKYQYIVKLYIEWLRRVLNFGYICCRCRLRRIIATLMTILLLSRLAIVTRDNCRWYNTNPTIAPNLDPAVLNYSYYDKFAPPKLPA